MRIESTIHKPIFRNLQALRGIAALLVCAFHYSYIIHQPWSKIAFSNGGIGVQVFFIISGFIMVHTTSGIKSNFILGAKTFLINRIIRVIPIYYICTFMFIADDLNNGYLVENGSRLLHSLLFISPLSKSIGPQFGPPSLEVGWSLNYEMMFYLIFTIAILFGLKKIHFLYSWFITFIFLIPLFCIGEISNNYHTFHEYPVGYLNLLSNPILIHFLLGITFALLIPKLKFNRTSSGIMLILAFIMFALYLTEITGLPINAWYDLIFCGFLVFSILINDYHPRGFQFPPIMVRFGDMSYSFYLLHPIVLGYIPLIASKLKFINYLGNTGKFVFAICLTTIVSYTFYKLVETPLTRYLKIKFSR